MKLIIKFREEREKELTEKNTNDNSPTKKVDKILYHRKIKSTLIGECLNKLDLPSNVNIINSLKKIKQFKK